MLLCEIEFLNKLNRQSFVLVDLDVWLLILGAAPAILKEKLVNKTESFPEKSLPRKGLILVAQFGAFYSYSCANFVAKFSSAAHLKLSNLELDQVLRLYLELIYRRIKTKTFDFS